MQLPPSSLPAAHPLPHTLVLERGASSEGGRSGRRLSPSLPPCAEGSDRPFSPARGELCPPAPGAFKGRLGGRDGTHNPPCPASPCFTTAASRASGAGGEPPALAPSPPTGSAELSSGSGPRRAAEAIAAHPSPSPRREGGDGAQPPPPPSARLPSATAARSCPGRSRRPPLASPAQRPSARTRAGAALPDLKQQDDDGRQVGQVPGEAEDVHGGGGRGGGAARSRGAKMA